MFSLNFLMTRRMPLYVSKVGVTCFTSKKNLPFFLGQKESAIRWMLRILVKCKPPFEGTNCKRIRLCQSMHTHILHVGIIRLGTRARGHCRQGKIIVLSCLIWIFLTEEQGVHTSQPQTTSTLHTSGWQLIQVNQIG